MEEEFVKMVFLLVTGISVWMEIGFLGSFLGRKAGLRQTVLYLLLIYGVFYLEFRLQSVQALSILAELFVLSVFGWLVLGCRLRETVPAAALAMAVIYLGTGMFNPVLDSIVPWSMGFPKGWVIVLVNVVNAMELLIIGGAYWGILKYVKCGQEQEGYFSLILFFPVILILIVTGFISDTLYGNVVEISTDWRIGGYPVNENIVPFLIFLTAWLCLLAVLYTYKKAMDGVRAAIEVEAMKQQLAMQQEYMDEAKLRYHQTASIRHDIKNHMLVLKGMINQGSCSRAISYLNRLEEISDSLSFPCSTGVAVVDILLANKLALAAREKIEVQCEVSFPKGFPIEDMDLCILFANAVDNAITAAGKTEEKSRTLNIEGRKKGNFYLIQIQNSCLPGDSRVEEGIGIKNMRQVVNKYQGILKLEMSEKSFCLGILFNIS